MGFTDLINRALTITYRYRALWIFGFLLALCGGTGGGSGGNFSGGSDDFSSFSGPTPDIDPALILAIVVAVLFVVLFLSLLSIIVVVITETALIAMVGKIEDEGSVTVREGFRLGTSKRAIRYFLVSLLIGVPVFFLVLLLIGIALSPLLLLLLDGEAAMIIGILSTIALALLMVFVIIFISIAVWPLRELAGRYAVLEQFGVRNSVGAAFGLIRRRLKDVLLSMLVLFLLGLAWGVISLLLFIVFVILAGIIGGIPALIAYLITQEPIVAAIAGGPLFLIFLILPLAFATGLYLIFQSALWTLIFRRLLALETQVETPPALQQPPLASATKANEPIEADDGFRSMPADDPSDRSQPDSPEVDPDWPAPTDDPESPTAARDEASTGGEMPADTKPEPSRTDDSLPGPEAAPPATDDDPDKPRSDTGV